MELKGWTSLRMQGRREEVVSTVSALCIFTLSISSVVGRAGAALSFCRVSAVCEG